jgi:hypothetical protein
VLAAHCLRLLLLPPTDAQRSAPWSPACEAAVSALTELLAERDAASAAAVALLGELVARQPSGAALAVLLQRLSLAPCTSERLNVLEALLEALECGAGQAAGDSSTRQFVLEQHVAQQLLRGVLPLLSDAALRPRQAAARLLGRLSPHCACAALLPLLAAQAGATRSAAAEALAAVLRFSAQPAEALTAMLQLLSGDAQRGAEVEKAQSRALDVLAAWAASDELGVAERCTLVDALLAQMAASPGCSALVKAASALAPALCAPGGAAPHLLSRVASMLAAPTGEGGDGDEAVFRRLQPLLLLRMLPLSVFDDSASAALYGGEQSCTSQSLPSECIASALLGRCADAGESGECRRLCAELLGRLRPTTAFPLLLAAVRGAAEAQQYQLLRSSLCALCSAFALRGSAAVPGTAPPPALLLLLLTRALEWPAEAEEVAKTQLGCIQLLALLVSSQLQRQARAPHRGITVLEASEEQRSTDAVPDVLTPLLRLISCAEQSFPWARASPPAATLPQLRACCANALIVAATRGADVSTAASLAQRAIPLLGTSLSGCAMSEDARASAFQVLFTTVHAAGGAAAPFAAQLASVAVASLQAARGREGEAARVGAAKLLAALLACEECLKVVVDDKQLLRIAAALRGVAAMDESAELRSICEQVARFTGG